MRKEERERKRGVGGQERHCKTISTAKKDLQVKPCILKQGGEQGRKEVKNNQRADHQSGFLIRKVAVKQRGRGAETGKDNTGRFIRTLGETALLQATVNIAVT